ncbi:MAG: mannose-1-phosphate guanylyltransferase/mannose-6-phosphate isomerase [Gammaproteobacteria bacterium]|nr:MAG: mannose-1-phosphate guanylyltransferase/mannose-6-phosphate isomerase [Gammaproteobacteria bacterium]
MVQETVLRLDGVEHLQAPIAICNEDHRFMMAEQLREINVQPEAIILEPVGKNTAPAVALAALAAKNPDDILLVLPADHVIDDVPAFQESVVQAGQLAEQGYLVTFGIVPTAAETGYGYIKRSVEKIADAFRVAEFVEKPDAEIAERYVASGEYYWNSGMFAFKAGRYLEELEKYAPEMLTACRLSFTDAQTDVDFVRLDKDIFSQCPADSIDYAVMEKTDKAVVIPLDADWSDVGSWSALWEVKEKDSFGNALTGDVVALDTKNSFIHSENKLVTAIGVQDMIIIETDDAVMIAPKNRVQDVKKIVAVLKDEQRAEADLHRKVYRPWGHYDSVDNGERHKTKRIVVKPGAKLSVQKHHHRAEHWVIVKGTALVSKGDETMLLSENESTYIPIGVIHSLENPGVIPLEMVEVQSGSYLGEDDIIRFEDKYGRT